MLMQQMTYSRSVRVEIFCRGIFLTLVDIHGKPSNKTSISCESGKPRQMSTPPLPLFLSLPPPLPLPRGGHYYIRVDGLLLAAREHAGFPSSGEGSIPHLWGTHVPVSMYHDVGTYQR